MDPKRRINVYIKPQVGHLVNEAGSAEAAVQMLRDIEKEVLSTNPVNGTTNKKEDYLTDNKSRFDSLADMVKSSPSTGNAIDFMEAQLDRLPSFIDQSILDEPFGDRNHIPREKIEEALSYVREGKDSSHISSDTSKGFLAILRWTVDTVIARSKANQAKVDQVNDLSF